jgi:hypothetical protein
MQIKAIPKRRARKNRETKRKKQRKKYTHTDTKYNIMMLMYRLGSNQRQEEHLPSPLTG